MMSNQLWQLFSALLLLFILVITSYTQIKRNMFQNSCTLLTDIVLTAVVKME